MMKRRLAVAMFLATFAGACSELAVPTEIEDPQMAQGGGKGKPGGGGAPVLEEFWVTQGSSLHEPDVIHVVWSGGGTSVNPSVIQDYFFDGIRQDDPPVDAHYEYLSGGPPKSPGEQIADGMMHVDIPWNGSRLEDGGAPYPNYVTTEVTGEGDPFAFTLNVYDGDTRLAIFVPFGVVVGGVNTFGVVKPEAEVKGMVHAKGMQRSYATFSGANRAGTMWVEDLSIEGGTLTCAVVTVTSGRGKNKTRTEKTVVSATIVVKFARSDPITLTNGEYTWWEGHFFDPSTGALSRRVSAPNESGVFSVSGVMPEGWSGDSVEFIVDYLVSSSSPNGSENEVIFSNYVYDPSSNGPPTTAGLLLGEGNKWSNDSPSASPGDGRFPVAHSQLVTCSAS